MKRKLFIIIATLFPMLANAHDFEVDGIYYDKMVYSLNPSVSVTHGEGSFRYQGSITIPETVTYEGVTYSVTSIGALAFSYCDGLTSVKIPNSVKNINAEAFSGCASLTAITFPGSLTEINSNAFYGCTGLLSIAIPKNLTSIEPSAFYGCNGIASITVDEGNPKYDSRNNCNAIIEKSTNELIVGCKNTIVPNGVESFGNYAFTDTDLTSIVIPSSVTNISQYAFNGCIRLASITVASDNPIYDSRDNCNAVIKTSTNELLAGCMNTKIPNTVVSIGDYAFMDCSNLASITIPNSVTSIGGYAFYNCSSLTSIDIPNSVMSIAHDAFRNCGSLVSITIPSSVTTIEGSSFAYCSSLTSVTIPDNITTIASSAFLCCI